MNDRRRRHRIGLVAAATLGVTGLVSGLTPGPAGAAQRADRDAYRTSGSAIKGALTSGDAPRLAIGQPRVDTIGAGETRYYAVELDSTSTHYVSAIAIPPSGAELDAYQDEIRVTLTRLDGGRCDTAIAGADAADAAHPFGTAVLRQPGPGASSRCGAAGRHLVSVARPKGTSSGSKRWAIELSHLREPKVVDGPTEPPDKGSWSTDEPIPRSDRPRPRNGGTGFNDAAELSPGAWQDTIAPGQTRFFKVPVSWGQQLLTSVEVPAPAGSSGRSTGSEGFLRDALGMSVYNPGHALLATNHFVPYKGHPTSSRITTAPIAYGNRKERSRAAVRAASIAGWYYVAVSLNPAMERYFKDGAPVTVRVRLAGERGAGPRYEGRPGPGGFGIEGRPSDVVPGPEATGTGGDDGVGLRSVAYGGFGLGTVLLVWLGTWKLAARRRATT